VRLTSEVLSAVFGKPRIYGILNSPNNFGGVRKMNKRLLALLSVLVLASLMLAACGTPAPVATEAPAAATDAPAAPAATDAPMAEAITLKIVSSLPMTGSSLTQTQTIVNAMQLRLEQANYSACGGKYAIEYEAWDDASAALGKWDPAVETENANKAAADTAIIAYLGTFNSGAADFECFRPIDHDFPGQHKPRFDQG
jgi:branched-chain amino acid transport system substrate-binding protein